MWRANKRQGARHQRRSKDLRSLAARADACKRHKYGRLSASGQTDSLFIHIPESALPKRCDFLEPYLVAISTYSSLPIPKMLSKLSIAAIGLLSALCACMSSVSAAPVSGVAAGGETLAPRLLGVNIGGSGVGSGRLFQVDDIGNAVSVVHAPRRASGLVNASDLPHGLHATSPLSYSLIFS